MRTDTKILLTVLSVTSAIGAMRLAAHPHGDGSPTPLIAANKSDSSPSDRGSHPIISGSGAFRFEYVPAKLRLPETVRMRHGHGLVCDTNGDIYFTFEPETITPDTRVLVRFSPDGTGGMLLGSDNRLAHGAPHGIGILVNRDGTRSLYHANNGATVHKTTLDGKVLWTQTWPAQMGNYKPTDVVVPPGGDRVFVADGYGSSMIHLLNTADGVYGGKSWGGLGSHHGELNCPHGLTFDPRKGLILVADRGNKRLEYFQTNGLFHSTVAEKQIEAPCNADIQGDYALVPDLTGPVFVLDKDNKVISTIQVGQLMGGLGFKHPHDAIWLDNGDIAVCTWNPGRLGYFRRIPDGPARQ